MKEIIDDINREDYDLVEKHDLLNAVEMLRALDANAFAATIKALDNAILVMA